MPLKFFNIFGWRHGRRSVDAAPFVFAVKSDPKNSASISAAETPSTGAFLLWWSHQEASVTKVRPEATGNFDSLAEASQSPDVEGAHVVFQNRKANGAPTRWVCILEVIPA